MKAFRSAVALVSTVAVTACHTVPVAGSSRVAPQVHSAATFMTSGNTAGIVRPAQSNAARPYSAAAIPGGTKTLLIVAVLAAVIVAAVLIADGDGDGGY